MIRQILLISGLAALPLFAEKPNFLFILADDLGIECIRAYGGQSYKTPHIDELTDTGLTFDHAYSTPKCSPSRVTLLTGRYTFRTTNVWGHIPREEISVANLLRDEGYATAIAGKWQLGRIVDEPDILEHFGFEKYCIWGWHEGPRYWKPLIWQNGKIRDDVKERYGPEVYTEFLIDFMEQHQDKPFLAYFPMCLPHLPKKNEPKGPDGQWETFGEMISQVDRMVGQLTHALDRLKLREKTLVIFTSDNGSPTNVTSIRNGKSIKGGKAKLNNAGTHVPLIAHWPGTVQSGRHDALIDFSDLLPTFVKLAGGQIPSDRIIDGHSFAWAITGQKGNSRDWIYTEWSGRSWIRTREWKLYDNRIMYDMKNDPEEKSALSVYSDDAVRAQTRAWLESNMANLKEITKP